MPLMTHAEHGYHNVPDHDIPAMEKSGWRVISADEFAEIVSRKKSSGNAEQEGVNVIDQESPATTDQGQKVTAQKKRGRKPKAA